MTREELIKQCRFYKGEEKNPYSGRLNDNGLIWDYERTWCEKCSEDPDYLEKAVTLYKEAGMETYRNGETPLSLMALIFAHYCRYFTYDTDEERREYFINWYERAITERKN